VAACFIPSIGCAQGIGRKTGIPVAFTQAGKVRFDTHPSSFGGLGVTGTESANRIAEKADLVLAIGTRLSDFHDGVPRRSSS